MGHTLVHSGESGFEIRSSGFAIRDTLVPKLLSGEVRVEKNPIESQDAAL